MTEAPDLRAVPDEHDRTPPQDMAAEASVLGAMMLDPRAIVDATEILEPADFYRPAHEQIYDAILKVYAAQERPDPIAVADQLRKDGDLTTVGGAGYLHTLSANVPTAANAAYYAQIVRDCAALRAVITAGTRMVQQAYAGTEDAAGIVETARTLVDGALAREQHQARTLADLYAEVVDIAENGAPKTLPLGFPDLDDKIGGIGPGQLVTVAAPTNVGKSLFALNAALHVASRWQHAVLFISLEMTGVEVMQRLLANLAAVNFTGLQGKRPRLTDYEWERVAKAKAEVEALPLFIDDTTHVDVTYVRKRARDIQRQRDDLALIVVDYLGLMDHGRGQPGENTATVIGRTTRGLKLLAKETGACVMALVQVNRVGTAREDGPTLSDLKDSSAIEQDSNVVVMGWESDPEVGMTSWAVRKNRNGPSGHVVSLEKWGHYARLVSVGQ